MSPRPAVITQAEIRRAIRAAKQEGAAEIELQPDGALLIRLLPTKRQTIPALDKGEQIVF